jgi:hypothetical protein
MPSITALTVSVNYTDFLVHILEENYSLFDRWVIVTDTSSRDVVFECNKYSNVVCIQTDVFYKDGAKFNKWAGINEALKLIDDGWVLFLDSDIVLHKETRRILNNLSLKEDCIYGVDRVNCNADEWEVYRKKRNMLVNSWLLTSAGLSLGSRLVHIYGHEGDNGKFAGWNPLGFFQLVHRKSFNLYPQNSKGADHCDIVFARLYPRDKRILIPEILAIHLESEFVIKGTNWYGRISMPFVTRRNRLKMSYLIKLMSRRILVVKMALLRKFKNKFGNVI